MGTHPEKGSDKTGHREVVKWGGTDVAAFGAWAETETAGVRKTIENGWSRTDLQMAIGDRLYEITGNALTNAKLGTVVDETFAAAARQIAAAKKGKWTLPCNSDCMVVVLDVGIGNISTS